MSIQKITSLSLTNKNLNNASKAKNSFASGISFKGYTKVITAQNGYGPRHYPDPYGTSAGHDDPGRMSTVDEYNIKHPENTTIERGKAGYESQSISSASAKVYFADQGEAITDRIRNDHMYIVKYNQAPKIVSEEDILKENKASKLKDYVDALEQREPYLKADLDEATTEENKAKNIVSAAAKKLEAAQKTYSEKQNVKAEKEQAYDENKKRLELAKKRLEEIKKMEADKFKEMQTRKKLEEMQKQLSELNDGSDSGLSAIAEQLKFYLSGKKGKQ